MLIIANGFLLFSFLGVFTERLNSLSDDSSSTKEFNNNIRASTIINSWEQVNYNNLTLNNSVSFDLNSTTTCSEVHFNFTSINETRDFIDNGNFDASSINWNAINETDVNYTWTDNTIANAECIGINLTGLSSEAIIKPLDNYSGIINFTTTDGWYLNNNITSKFQHNRSLSGKDPISNSLNFPDATGSLIHELNGSMDDGMANSSYQFFYNASYPISYINLSFWYHWYIQWPGGPWFDKIDLGVFLITPNQDAILLNSTILNTQTSIFFEKKSLDNISEYFTDTGYYNLTFYTKHLQNSDGYTRIYFDDIELQYTFSYKEFVQNNATQWNQSINFPNRDVYSNGIFNISYYITEKIERNDNSEVFLCVWINNNRIIIDNLNNMVENTWDSSSMSIDKDLIQADPLNISVGLYFNATTQVFINESFSIFFDNISFTIGTNPHPELINLQVSSTNPQLNDTFIVNRDVFNNDFVNVSNSSFTWSSGQTHWLNITSNSSNLIVYLTISYFISQDIDDTNSNGGETPPLPEPINVTIIIMVLLLIMSITSFLFVSRVQKRIFLNPKYDYIKKLQTKRKINISKERLAPVEAKRMCQTCRRPINLTAQFCEHCGQPQ